MGYAFTAFFFQRAKMALASAAVALLAACPSWAQDNTKPCAVVLLHGKWGNTQYIGHFGRRLEPYCTVKAVEMPWSQRRGYDAPYPQALQEVQAQVQAFRAEGFQRVAVMGHSFGGNAAMAYMAHVGDADAVVVLAPGHVPALMYERGIGKEAVDKARALVQSGQGGETLTMDDLNQGKRQSIRMTADVLLSYFDPAGLGHMPATAAGFKKAVPFLWVVGTGDRAYDLGEDYAFRKAPMHAASKYLVVTADHASTPDAAVEPVSQWLKSLP
ncbi:MAG: alpha/beta hydrolase [Rhodoferax sp.]